MNVTTSQLDCCSIRKYVDGLSWGVPLSGNSLAVQTTTSASRHTCSHHSNQHPRRKTTVVSWPPPNKESAQLISKNHTDPNFLHPTMLGWRLSDKQRSAMILAEASAPDVQRESSQEWILVHHGRVLVLPSCVPTEGASRSVDAHYDWHETLAVNSRALSVVLRNRN